MDRRLLAGTVIAWLYNGVIGKLPSRRLRHSYLRRWLGSWGPGAGVQIGCRFLNGRKVWVANAEAADLFIIFAATHPSAGSRQGLGGRSISAFLVPADTAGADRGRRQQAAGAVETDRPYGHARAGRELVDGELVGGLACRPVLSLHLPRPSHRGTNGVPSVPITFNNIAVSPSL